MLKLVASSPQVSLDVHSTSSTGHQTGLAVTTARQHGVVADLDGARRHGAGAAGVR